MQVDYTAKRSLKAGHVLNTSYVINIGLVESDRRPKNMGAQNIAISGNTVSIIHRGDILLPVNTKLVNASSTPDIDDMREFLDSVRFGETFQLDSVNYIMSNFKDPYQEKRIHPSYFRYSFMARKL